MGDKKNIQDYYASVCRTCLKSSGEMQSLAALINDNVRHGDAEISYMDCLQYCMPSEARTEGDTPLPTMICIDCASALQVAYWFMKNASKAQEVLKIRIKELQEKQKQLEKQAASAAAAEVKKPKRYRCKVCNTKLETKRSLKDHVKLHLDIIAYNCQLCTFEHHQRNYLIEHYQLIHGVEATAEQLKPKTKTSPPTPTNTTSTTTTTIRQNDNFVGEQEQQQLQQQTCEVYVETTPTHNSHDIIYTTTLHQPQQNQNFVYTTTSVNSTDVTTPLEGNATTTIFAQPNAETFTFNAFEGDLNVHNDPNVGNEFIVMADGSVENVMGKGVVIEYINSGEDGTTLALENGLVLDNILQVQNPAETTNMIIAQQNDMVQMDVDDLIIEDPENTPEQTQDVPPSPIDEDMIPATFIEQPKRNICKICAKEFDTQDELKTHMLTHSEIPHFFCDQCTFYTFFKIDLHQHYKSKHNLQPTSKQLQPKNKQSRSSEADMDPQTKNAIVQKIERYARSQRLVYSCDICFYECDLKYEIRRHYLAKHRMNVQDVQQRPTRSSTNAIQPISNNTPTAAASTGEPQPSSKPKSKMKANATVNISTPMEDTLAPDYINGLNCRKCNEVFFYRNKLYEHYKLHSAEEESLKQQKQALKVQKNNTQTTVNSSLQQTQAPTQLIQTSQEVQKNNTQTTVSSLQHTQAPAQLLQSSQALVHNKPHPQLLEVLLDGRQYLEPPQSESLQLPQPHQEVVITTTPLDSSLPTFNNVDPMSLVLTPNNNPAAPLTPSSSSTYTLPSDAIPQVVEMEQTIETDMDFDFNGDALFEDFDDVDVENESDDNDLRNIVLTSDDDFDDMLKEQGETQTQTTTSYCAQCQKSFLSQYQFENHMFLHRGLAPYRCEMCTNLYNTKRALIRHYNAIHKKIPSRDMIQAKGDKVYIYDKTPTDYLTLEESKAITLMCAKCTYESTDFPSVQLHLNTNHSIHDDSFILRKLSYECPRCIRSFSTKAKLLRHLERNHAATPINHPPIQINSIDTATATTTTTTTTAPSLNNNVNMMQMNATSGKVYQVNNNNNLPSDSHNIVNNNSKHNSTDI